MNNEEKLVGLLENLFNPINNKDYGLYWNVSNNKKKPLANATELLKYIRKESKEGSFINRYASLTEDLVLENNIYLDFDLTNKDYLKAERSLTEKYLETLSNETLNIEQASNYHEKNNTVVLKQIQDKYNKNYSVTNGFSKGYKNFIDGLTLAEEGVLKKLVAKHEKEEVKDLKEHEVQQYYINKFEQDYLKEPYKDVIKTAKYFESIGIETIINLSGSKGFHLRIPITKIDFVGTDLEENPENVKLFLEKLAELIETKILEKPYKKSSLDYAVFKKGMQRIPCSKHNKTKLYANFISSKVNYNEAIDNLELKVPEYIPKTIDLETNTAKLIESDIYKATIKKATEEATNTFKSEATNSNYKFNGQHKELLEIISKVYLPSVRNEVGFRIVHLLRRSNFKKSEVEEIFKQLHDDPTDYKTTIKGSIDHAYKTEKLVGLRSLIKWLKANSSEEVKAEVIEYFSKKFKYYEVPTETLLEDVLLIHEKEHNLKLIETSNKKYYLLENIDYVEGNNLEIHKTKNVVYFKQQSKLIAKLELRKNSEGLVPTSKIKLDKFKKRIHKLTKIEPEIIAETIEELDNYISYLEDQQEEEKQLQEQEEEITEVIEETEDNNIKFGRTEKGYYEQSEKGIEYNEIHIKNNEYEIKTTPIANVVINEVTIVLDSLGVLEPVYNVTYNNLTFNKEVTVEYLNKKQLTEEFIEANVFYTSTKDNVETVLNAFIIDGTKEDRITVKTEAYLEGFYIVDGNIIENTKLKNLKKYNSSDVSEAILLLNEIMKDRTAEGKANDSTVYRFMLWNPFSYCLKQIGYRTGIYSLILIGKSKGNKTGAINIGNLFYLNTEEETSGSTVSVLGSKLEENSFSKVFDECYNLLKQPETPDVMKKAVQEKTTRITKNRNDNKKTDVFNAFGLPVFLLNERLEFKDFIQERYKITDYTSRSYLSKDDRKEFNKKYVPDDKEGTVLRKLAVIGNEFKNKIVPLIEAKDKRLFNIEELTVNILKEIAQETTKAIGKPIDFLPCMYNITEASNKYNYDVAEAIRTLLNTEFKKKNHLTGNNSYSGFSFTNSIINNDFDFITYNKYRTANTSEREFIINSSGLVKYVNNHVEETVELEDILNYLNLDSILKEKAEANNIPYNKFINKQFNIKVDGSSKNKNITGFYLTVEELANNLFSFNIDFSAPEKHEEIVQYENVENEN